MYVVGFTIGPIIWLLAFIVFLNCREKPAQKQSSPSDHGKWEVWSAKSREEYY